MDELLKGALAGFRLIVFCGLAGAAFTFGVAVVCRYLKWSPINITVNIQQKDG